MLGLIKTASITIKSRYGAHVAVFVVVTLVMIAPWSLPRQAAAESSGPSYTLAMEACADYGWGISWTGGTPNLGGYAQRYPRNNFCLYSPDRTYHVLFQTDGDLVEYHGSKEIWHAGTRDTGVFLQTQPDGNVAIYNASDQIIWETATDGFAGTGRELMLQNNGSFTVERLDHETDQGTLWTSGTLGK